MRNRRAFDAAALVLLCLGIIAANLAPVGLLIAFAEWLTDSEWPGLTVADGLALLGVRSYQESDAKRVVDLTLAIPFSISLFTVGILLVITGLKVGDWGLRRELRA